MISRREVVSAGVLGTLAGATVDLSADARAERAKAEGAQQQTDPAIKTELDQIEQQLQRINTSLENGPRVVSGGLMGQIRERYTTHLRAAGKFPDFLEVGTDAFYEVYDWHVKHNQQIQITRISEQRFAIQWMFTQLIVRFENDSRYLGVPFDRG
jgi:hypothetical protein